MKFFIFLLFSFTHYCALAGGGCSRLPSLIPSRYVEPAITGNEPPQNISLQTAGESDAVHSQGEGISLAAAAATEQNDDVEEDNLGWPEQEFQLEEDESWQILPCSGFQNNCFFNAIRHYGINITREEVQQLLFQFRHNPRWRAAVLPLALRELLEIPRFADERLQDLRNYYAQYLDVAQITDPEDVTLLYDFFIERLQAGIPMPFLHANEIPNGQMDFLELLGRRFGFDLRIVQEDLQVIRFFNHAEREDRRRITLRYTTLGGEGHFDLIGYRDHLPSPSDDDSLEDFGQIICRGRRGEYLYRYFPQAIASGSQGKIFLAQDDKTGKKLVVKYLKFTDQFPKIYADTELNILSKLIHSGIPAFIEAFRNFQNTHLVIIQEYIPNTITLRNLIASQFELIDSNQILDWIKQLAEILGHIHQRGITHGDVKPENILVSKDRKKVYLIDFGLAFEGSEKTGRGSYAYMAPEIYQQQELTSSIDIWALGVVLYELHHQIRPFNSVLQEKDKKIRETQQKVTTGETPQLNSPLTLLNTLFNQMMLRNPTLRITAIKILALFELDR